MESLVYYRIEITQYSRKKNQSIILFAAGYLWQLSTFPYSLPSFLLIILSVPFLLLLWNSAKSIYLEQNENEFSDRRIFHLSETREVKENNTNWLLSKRSFYLFGGFYLELQSTLSGNKKYLFILDDQINDQSKRRLRRIIITNH